MLIENEIYKMKRIVFLSFYILFLGCTSAFGKGIYHRGWIDFNKNGKLDIFEDKSRSIDERVNDLLGQMTIEEKTCQLATLYGYGRVLKDSLPTAEWKQSIWKDGIANIDEQLNGVGRGFTTAYNLIYPFGNHTEALNLIQKWFIEETRLGIPVEFSNEGIHGLNHTLATPLPAPIGLGCTWNRNLIYTAGRIAGYEAQQLGYHSVYAPILDIARDPRWGRTLECYSEDPYLTAELGIQMTRGIQSQGIASCLKHYAAYSVPAGGRDGGCRTDPQINPQDLHSLFLYPFRRVIEEASPLEIMASYNDWNGEPVIASKYFLTDLLRKQYGFTGYVVSDSEAVEFVHTKHAVATDMEEAARLVLEAGLNVRTNFTRPEDFILPVRNLIAKGKISMQVIDARVRDVLRVKFLLGLFDNPYRKVNKQLEIGAASHTVFADSVQEQAMVLLKNSEQLLPLNKEKIKHILVTGPMANETNFMSSRYGPNGLECISVLKGLQQYTDCNITYEKGCDIVDRYWPESELYDTPLTANEEQSINKAVAAAINADVIIAVMGEDEYTTGESRSRTSLNLPGRQEHLLRRLYDTGKPIVLVLINGQPLTINWANDHIPAILEAWFPHYRGGIAIARTLFGDNNPSGKLSVTFPKSVGQIPYAFPFKKGARGLQPKWGNNGTGHTRVTGALYPFGYGLSYTEFSYSKTTVDTSNPDNIKVSCTITNTGKREGTEIAQLYMRCTHAPVTTYESQLIDFERISLKPAESKTITFTVQPSQLQLYNTKGNALPAPNCAELNIAPCSSVSR